MNVDSFLPKQPPEHAQASEDQINKHNNRMLYPKLGIALAACLGSELEFIDMSQFGYNRFEISRFLRWYATDYVNAIMWLGLYNIIITTAIQLLAHERAKKNNTNTPLLHNGYPLLLAVGGMGIAARQEYFQSLEPGRVFDWYDMLSYGLGYGTYVAASWYIHQRAKRKLAKEIGVAS